MYEVGQRVRYEGTATRDGVTLEVAGDFVCVDVTGDGQAILVDARYVDAPAPDVTADVPVARPVADSKIDTPRGHTFRVTA